MGLIVDLRKLRCGELGVALGCGEALMSKQFLNSAEVCAFLQQMCSEGVAQRVRMHVGGESAQDSDALDDARDGARGEARAA